MGIDKLRQNVYKAPGMPEGPRVNLGPQLWVWAFGQTPRGKRTLLGPFFDEAEAATRSRKLVDVEYFHLDTRDTSRAVKEIRACLLKRGKDPDDALSRQLHERGLAREAGKGNEGFTYG